MSPPVAEFIGTALQVLLGDGVVAGVLFANSESHAAGWVAITLGWGLAVFVPVFAFASISGAQINPAVSVGLAISGHFEWAQVSVYIVAQLSGAVVGAVLVWVAYLPHWKPTNDQVAKLSVFCPVPAIRNFPANFVCEGIGTFVLIFGILTLKGVSGQPANEVVYPIDLGAIGALPVALLVVAIGLSLGGPTGYAINPARDFSPRLAHALLPIPGKGKSDWGYSWIPICGPLVGGTLGAVLYVALGKF